MRANYENMINLSNIITKNGEQYRTDINNLYSQVEELNRVWKGSDNETFVSSVNQYKQNLIDLGSILTEYGEFMNKTALSIKETQDKIKKVSDEL